MKTYTFETRNGDYTVSLTATDKRAKTGQIKTKYSLTDPKGKVVFSGSDLGCSPLNTPESKENALALLSFLTLRKGDTDEDYFDNYTPEQLSWTESDDCEDLSMFGYDL